MFIGLKSFNGSLAGKCMSLNNEQCKIRLTLIDLNPVELKYYSFMITLNKCNGICNTVGEVSGKTCDPSKTEDVNFSLF